MKKQLFERSKAEKKILGIHTNGDSETFWLGYVEDYNDEIVQFRIFDSYGREDGLLILSQDTIDSIDFDSEYEKGYEYLINKNYDLNQFEEICSFQDSEDWINEYLKEYKSRNEVIALELSGDDLYYGYVLDVADDEFIFNQLINTGEGDGNIIYKTEDITAIRLASCKCKLRQELNTWRRNK